MVNGGAYFTYQKKMPEARCSTTSCYKITLAGVLHPCPKLSSPGLGFPYASLPTSLIPVQSRHLSYTSLGLLSPDWLLSWIFFASFSPSVFLSCSLHNHPPINSPVWTFPETTGCVFTAIYKPSLPPLWNSHVLFI